MTNGIGSKHTPKDFRFENLLRQQFSNEKYEKIIYYDTCVISKDKKTYGKIIICDDSIYSFIEALNKFEMELMYKDIYSIEMVNDIPNFIFGPMRNNNLHIRIKYDKSIRIIKETPLVMPTCCIFPAQNKSSRSVSRSIRSGSGVLLVDDNNGQTLQRSSAVNLDMSDTSACVKHCERTIDYYILNLFSPALHLLKKARIDFLIRETLSVATINKSLTISQTLANRIFDDLVLDMTQSQSQMVALRDYLLELTESGLKYHRVKILFWSKPDLFEFMFSQFNGRRALLSKVVETPDTSPLTANDFIKSYLRDLNVLLQVFNTFLFETDHLPTKSRKLQNDNGRVALSLIESDLSLIAYFYDCDQDCDLDPDSSDLANEIDILKHAITVSSIQLFYHLLCSSEINVEMLEVDRFSSQTIVHLLETLSTFDSSEGVFNRFVNQCLQMIYIWIFPKMFKFPEKLVDADQMITIYQFFSSLRIIAKCVPKFTKFFRHEMSEEFEHFVLNDLTFNYELPISSLTVKLLKSFQKNLVESNDIFTDNY